MTHAGAVARLHSIADKLESYDFEGDHGSDYGELTADVIRECLRELAVTFFDEFITMHKQTGVCIMTHAEAIVELKRIATDLDGHFCETCSEYDDRCDLAAGDEIRECLKILDTPHDNTEPIAEALASYVWKWWKCIMDLHNDGVSIDMADAQTKMVVTAQAIVLGVHYREEAIESTKSVAEAEDTAAKHASLKQYDKLLSHLRTELGLSGEPTFVQAVALVKFLLASCLAEKDAGAHEEACAREEASAREEACANDGLTHLKENTVSDPSSAALVKAIIHSGLAEKET